MVVPVSTAIKRGSLSGTMTIGISSNVWFSRVIRNARRDTTPSSTVAIGKTACGVFHLLDVTMVRAVARSVSLGVGTWDGCLCQSPK